MSESNVCGRCQQPLKSHETISVANVGLRCYQCFNEETAAMMGVDFDNTPLQPIAVSDADGIEHTFEFRSMLVGTGHALEFFKRVRVNAAPNTLPPVLSTDRINFDRPPKPAERAALLAYLRKL